MLINTRAVLSPGNRAKPRRPKFRYVKPNDSTQKTVFNAKYKCKLIFMCFNVDKMPLGDYIFRHNETRFKEVNKDSGQWSLCDFCLK